MVSIAPVKGSGSYYLAGDEPATWWGDAVPLLGLPHNAEPEVFLRLLDGQSPDGKLRLVAPHPRRDEGWDITFNAPKDASILNEFSSEATRRIIESCHTASVTLALKFIQSEAGFCRRGHAGARREPAALLFMLRKHHFSRELEPHLHTHAVAVNLAIRADHTCGAVHSVLFYRIKKLAGAIYQAELARNLTAKLGLKIIPTKHSFNIEGVPQSLRHAFSTRRKQIEARLENNSTAKDAQIACLKTRPAKRSFDLDAIRARWEEVAKTHQWDRERAESLIRTPIQRLLDNPASQELTNNNPTTPQWFGGNPAAVQPTEHQNQPSNAGKPLPVATEKPLASSQGHSSSIDPSVTSISPSDEATLWGDGARRLGLPAQVGPEVYLRLFNGLSPDGQRRLIPPDGTRRWIRPIEFSAPPSLALLYLFVGEESRARIHQCHLNAVSVALRYLQTQAGFASGSSSQQLHEPAGLIFKLTTHELDKHLQPALQTYALPLHLAVLKDNSYGSVVLRLIDEARRITQVVYETEMAKSLNLELGVEVRPLATNYDVIGVPTGLIKVLQDKLNNPLKPTPSPSVSNLAAGTVPAEEPSQSLLPELRRKWAELAARHHWGPDQAGNMLNQHVYREPDLMGFRRRLTEEVQHLPVSRRSAWSVVKVARQLALESSVGGEQLLRTMCDIKEFREPLYRFEWIKMFPKAPSWSPASLVKQRVLVSGGRPRPWGQTLAKKDILGVEVRLQMLRIFPRIPRWHWGSKVQIPAIHIAAPEARQRYIIRPGH